MSKRMSEAAAHALAARIASPLVAIDHSVVSTHVYKVPIKLVEDMICQRLGLKPISSGHARVDWEAHNDTVLVITTETSETEETKEW